jgi:hypothetical protein
MAALGDFPAEVVAVDTALEIERRIAAGLLGAGLE